MDLKVEKLRAYRHLMELGIPGIDIGEARARAKTSVSRAIGYINPWINSILEEARKEDDLDLVARWYIIYAPERLQKLGVDFG